MENILSIKNDFIYLNSSLSEELFAKTKFSLMLNETGYIVSKSTDGTFSDFKPWKFTGTKTINDTAYFSGDGFSGKNAEDIIYSNSPDTDTLLFAVCQAYMNAVSQNISLPCNGPQGILYDRENQKLLFVPEKNFEKCAKNLGKKEYFQIQNSWRDSAANGKEALAFSLANYAYYAITKRLPFPVQENLEETENNLANRNFLPLDCSINGINKELADYINSCLIGKNAETSFPLQLFENELFNHVSQKNSISAEQFENYVKSKVLKQQKKLKRQRAFDRYFVKSLVGFAAAAFVAIFTANVIHENGKKPCVIGLDSAETTKIFYSGIHHMDTDLMLASAKDCPQAQRYISQVPQIYVASQMKSAYNFETGLSTPENWMFFEPDTTRSYSHFIFGLTNFTIDGIPSTLTEKAPTKKNHKHRITRAKDGRAIELSPEEEHTVHFYLVHTVDNMLTIEECTTRVKLNYRKDRWQITELEQNFTTESDSPLPFSLDYKQALKDFDHNEILAIDSLRTKYPWVPTTESMKIEKARLDAIGY